MTRARAELLVTLLTELEAEEMPPDWRAEIQAVKDITFAVSSEPDPDPGSWRVRERKLRAVT